ncbi:MAG: epoxyqueuosine reductase [Candidatus Freyarchaeota archaeon]
MREVVVIRELIENFIKSYVKSYRRIKGTFTDWKTPLVAYADADDPLFKRLREIVDEGHLLPFDLLDDAKTVVSYFIPFQKRVALSNAGGECPSREWATAYVETNQLITDLNASLAEKLKDMGFKCVVVPPTHNFDRRKLISSWSHKHVAFIAGLGTFGLHQMIITEEGCCGRLGSEVTNVEIEPTQRPEREFCLYKRGERCTACVDNCTFGALKVNGFDRHRCYEVCLQNGEFYSSLGLADVCGKCVCVVPCSFRAPV